MSLSGDLVNVFARLIAHKISRIVLNVWLDSFGEELKEHSVFIDVAAFARAFLTLLSERSVFHSALDAPGAHLKVSLHDVLITRVLLQESLKDETVRHEIFRLALLSATRQTRYRCFDSFL